MHLKNVDIKDVRQRITSAASFDDGHHIQILSGEY